MSDIAVENWIDSGLDEAMLEFIRKEDRAQREKWGQQSHTPAEWLMFITEELGELAEAIGDHTFRDMCGDDVRNEAVQVATLAIKIAQMYGEAVERAAEREREEYDLVAHEADRRADDAFMSGNC